MSPAVRRILTSVAGLLLGCSGHAGTSTTDTGDPKTSEGVTSTATGATTTTDDAVTTTDTGPADGCLGDAACAPDQCVGPTDEVCLECLPTMLSCASDFDCAIGDVCTEVPVACACDTGFTTVCIPPCTTSADCDAGGVCNLESSHCVHDPCVGDQDCPPLFACVPVLGGDACRRRGCESDADCADAVCIDGLCHAGPGSCVPTI